MQVMGGPCGQGLTHCHDLGWKKLSQVCQLEMTYSMYAFGRALNILSM